MRHRLQRNCCFRCQHSFAFFYECPQLIAFSRCQLQILYQIIIHQFCMFRHICQQIPYRIPMMTRYSLNTPYSIFLDKVFAYRFDLFLRKMFMIKWGVWRLDKPFSTMVAVILLMACGVLSTFEYILFVFFQIVFTKVIRTGNVDFSSRSAHTIALIVWKNRYIMLSILGHYPIYISRRL